MLHFLSSHTYFRWLRYHCHWGNVFVTETVWPSCCCSSDVPVTSYLDTWRFLWQALVLEARFRFTLICSLVNWSHVKFADRPFPKTLNITGNSVCEFECGLSELQSLFTLEFGCAFSTSAAILLLGMCFALQFYACAVVSRRMRSTYQTAICDGTRKKIITKPNLRLGHSYGSPSN